MTEHRQRLLDACRKFAETNGAEGVDELFLAFLDWPIEEMPDVKLPDVRYGFPCVIGSGPGNKIDATVSLINGD